MWPTVRSFTSPIKTCTLQDPALNESSGVSTSRARADIVFSHNDSGGGPFLFAVNTNTCVTDATYRVAVGNFDWEELSSATLPTGEQVLLVGDIGDNFAFRDSVDVVAVIEPNAAPSASEQDLQVFTTFQLRYPAGPADAECMLFDPASGEFAIITKSLTGGARLLVAPDGLSATTIDMRDDGVVVLPSEAEGKTEDRLLAVTGCTVSPDGQALVVRTPDIAWEYPLSNGDFAAALAGTPTELEVPNTVQGESVTYSLDGSSLIWTTEGEGAPLFRSDGGVVRAAAAPPTTVAEIAESQPTATSAPVEVEVTTSSSLTDPGIAASLVFFVVVLLVGVTVLRVRFKRAQRRRQLQRQQHP